MADHRETSRRALEAFNTGEFDSLEGVYTADCAVHDTQNAFAAQARGLDVLRGQVSMFRAASPDLTMTIDAEYEDGNVVINRWTSTATQTGDLPMLPATGRTATVTGILIDRYEGDQIARSGRTGTRSGCCNNSGRSHPANPPLPRPPR